MRVLFVSEYLSQLVYHLIVELGALVAPRANSMCLRNIDPIGQANDVIREKRNGALAIPNGSCLNTHFPSGVTEAVLSCSNAATGI